MDEVTALKEYIAHLESALESSLALNKAQANRRWVSLTDEEIKEGAKYSWVDYQAFQSVAWWADEKLKEKNGGY